MTSEIPSKLPSTIPSAIHSPVLLKEVMQLLAPKRGGLFIDCTLGLGGHSEAMLEASPEVKVIGIDRDAQAIELASKRLEKFKDRFRAVKANFHEVAQVIENKEHGNINGILVDLGVSSLQLDRSDRGFSFRHDAPLDMRMDQSSGETVADLLNDLSEEEIARIIFEYGEEKRSRRIARWIVEKREAGEPIKTTLELSSLVARAVGHRKGEHVHPATRTFQALRIAVNKELDNLDQFIEVAIDLLKSGGRFAAISFHSLEDRIIKRTLRRLSGQCECGPRVPVCICGARSVVEILTRRPVTPAENELDQNPRARSAKLRACIKS
jgi:16S rRNA (cytosine1402-N4)-methyltransferase